jgi:hypothetical protein
VELVGQLAQRLAVGQFVDGTEADEVAQAPEVVERLALEQVRRVQNQPEPVMVYCSPSCAMSSTVNASHRCSVSACPVR